MFFKQIYVDMDGVLCDLHKALLNIHFRADLYPPKEWLTGETLGKTRDDFWLPVIKKGADFWAEVDPYPWIYDLMGFVSKITNSVTILTRPLILDGSSFEFAETGQCVEGKLRWLHRHFGDRYGVIFTDLKNKVSRDGALLIDDDQNYEEAFKAAGGHQFIWPQPYNKFSRFVGREMHSITHWYQLLLEKGESVGPEDL